MTGHRPGAQGARGRDEEPLISESQAASGHDLECVGSTLLSFFGFCRLAGFDRQIEKERERARKKEKAEP
jgi:hypothetical protein